jgi:hypothetical protein
MKIQCAAIRRGKRLATGTNHTQARLNSGGMAGGECGFLTNDQRFVSRIEAATIALAAGQADKISRPEEGLNSEELVHDYPPE